jgi:hypothetical protein
MDGPGWYIERIGSGWYSAGCGGNERIMGLVLGVLLLLLLGLECFHHLLGLNVEILFLTVGARARLVSWDIVTGVLSVEDCQ